MLSLIDCIAFSGLTPAQAEAVACFKHVPLIVAAEWAEEALDSPDGCAEVIAILEFQLVFARDHHLSQTEERRQALEEFRLAHAA